MTSGLSRRKQRERDLHRDLASSYERYREADGVGGIYSRSWLGHMLDEIPALSNRRVLDVGCGTGILFELLAQRASGATYVGVDLSPEMLDVGRRRHRDIDLREMDGEELLFADASFDLVISRSLLHHLPDPSKALNEMWRVLSPGGWILLSEPVRHLLTDLPRRLLWRWSSHFDEEHTHFRSGHLLELIAATEARDIGSRPFGYLAYPWGFPDILPPTRHLPTALLRGLIAVDEAIARIPGIRRFCWHLMVFGRKRETG